MMRAILAGFLLVCAFSSLKSQNVNVSGGLIFEGEPYLAINPLNGNHMVAAWMGYQFGENIVIKTKVTLDGGNSWTSSASLPHLASGHTSADPSLEFDRNGDVFLSYVDYNPSTLSAGSVLVAKSTDGGASWGTGVVALDLSDDPGKLCIDRPWIAIDTTQGTFSGNIYVTTTNAKLGPVSPPYNPYIAVSSDGGSTFNNPRYLDSASVLAGDVIIQPMPYPVVSSDGTLYCSYPSYVSSQSLFPQIFVASSNDGGTGFNYNIAYTGTGGVTDNLAKKASPLISNPDDPGNLILVGLLDLNGDADVYLLESTDFGQSWSSPIRVNDDAIANGKMQDMAWAGFDLDGDLAVCWRDRRNGGSGYETDTEIWCGIRCKDSTSFEPNFSISDGQVAHDTILNESGNDAMCLKFQNDTLRVVWGDVRSGRVNIYYNAVSKGEAVSTSEIVSEEMPTLLYPNPSSGMLNLKGINKATQYQIIDLKGKVVKSGTTQNGEINTNLVSGFYFLQTENNAYRFVIER